MVDGQNFVIPILNEKATLTHYAGVNPEGQEMEDLLKIKVRSNGEEQLIELFGDKGFVSNRNQFQLGGLNFLFPMVQILPNTFFYRLERFSA